MVGKDPQGEKTGQSYGYIKELGGEPADKHYVAKFHKGLLHFARGRRFVALFCSHYGQAPCVTEVGDLCCMIFGRSSPSVFRKRDRDLY